MRIFHPLTKSREFRLQINGKETTYSKHNLYPQLSVTTTINDLIGLNLKFTGPLNYSLIFVKFFQPIPIKSHLVTLDFQLIPNHLNKNQSSNKLGFETQGPYRGMRAIPTVKWEKLEGVLIILVATPVFVKVH